MKENNKREIDTQKKSFYSLLLLDDYT